MVEQTGLVNTVALRGIETIPIQVQIHISAEMPAFIISGLGDKAVAESRERIKSALRCIGVALPAKRIVVNMSPANIPKEGSHYDLPIALGILQALGLIKSDALSDYVCIGELGLSGELIRIPGALVTSIHACQNSQGIICPFECGSEAAYGGDLSIIAARHLMEIIQHFKGQKLCPAPDLKTKPFKDSPIDFADVVGNEVAKRALEIAAAGGHHLLMIGPPGVGKSMLAMRLPTIMPDLSVEEMVEISMIHSVAGMLKEGLMTNRPFRDPHHNTSLAAMLGGGRNSMPGEISLAHLGILFMDELTLWPPSILNGLRESLETGHISVARANSHIKYPARNQLIAAMNPCPCGKALEKSVQCPKMPNCVQNYMNRIPGPIMDRFAMTIQVDQVPPWENASRGDSSKKIKAKVTAARQVQYSRTGKPNNEIISSDDKVFNFDPAAVEFLAKFAQVRNLSNRKYYNAKRVARTIADLAGKDQVSVIHIREALTY